MKNNIFDLTGQVECDVVCADLNVLDILGTQLMRDTEVERCLNGGLRVAAGGIEFVVGVGD